MKYLLAVLVLCLFVSSAGAQVVRGKAPPDSLGVDSKRNDIHVSDYRGKVVVVTFWASWCGACLLELPILENLQRHVGNEEIQVIAVNTDKDPLDYRKALKRMQDYQLAFTADYRNGSVARRFDVRMLPYMILIDRAGLVAHVHAGYGESMLAELVNEINGLLDAPLAQAGQLPD